MQRNQSIEFNFSKIYAIPDFKIVIISIYICGLDKSSNMMFNPYS